MNSKDNAKPEFPFKNHYMFSILLTTNHKFLFFNLFYKTFLFGPIE